MRKHLKSGSFKTKVTWASSPGKLLRHIISFIRINYLKEDIHMEGDRKNKLVLS